MKRSHVLVAAVLAVAGYAALYASWRDAVAYTARLHKDLAAAEARARRLPVGWSLQAVEPLTDFRLHVPWEGPNGR